MAVATLLLVVLSVSLDQPALSEIVSVGPVNLASLAGPWFCGDRSLGASAGPRGTSPRCSLGMLLIAAFRCQSSDDLSLVLLAVKPVSLDMLLGGGLFWCTSPLGAALCFRLSDAFFRQSEQLRDRFDIMRLELAYEVLVGHLLRERHDHGGWRDAGDGIANLAETLDVSLQHFAFALFYREEVSAGSRLRETTQRSWSQTIDICPPRS